MHTLDTCNATFGVPTYVKKTTPSKKPTKFLCQSIIFVISDLFSTAGVVPLTYS